MNNEQIFLGSCFLEGGLVDLAVQDGLKADAFTATDRRNIWLALLESRTNGRLTDLQSIFLEMGDGCPSGELFACEKSAPTHSHGKRALKGLLEEHVLRQLKPALYDVISKIDDKEGMAAVKSSVTVLDGILKPSGHQDASLPEVVESALLWAVQTATGTVPVTSVVTTGLPKFDESCTPIEKHEYVVLGARTSHGKSSLLNQIAGHNLNRGLKVVVFSLETSARSVVMQIAAQRVGINLRLFRHEDKNRQEAFGIELNRIKGQPLMVFDNDLTLERIESRCRLLAASFKPDLTCIDYLGLIKCKADGAYERMSLLSKAMIPLKKSLGCPLIVAAQLNRGNEREDRAPTRTDFRDTGSIEEDASRILAIHRPSKDDSGISQGYDRMIYQTELFQLKMRDGPLAQGRCKFYAGHTRFAED